MTVRHVDGCANWQACHHLLHRVLEHLGQQQTLMTLQALTTAERAEALRCRLICDIRAAPVQGAAMRTAQDESEACLVRRSAQQRGVGPMVVSAAGAAPQGVLGTARGTAVTASGEAATSGVVWPPRPRRSGTAAMTGDAVSAFRCVGRFKHGTGMGVRLSSALEFKHSTPTRSPWGIAVACRCLAGRRQFVLRQGRQAVSDARRKRSAVIG